jgi:hypothetical protein
MFGLLNRPGVKRRLFNIWIYSALKRKKHVVVLGDSHARVFSYISEKQMLPNVWLDVTVVGGATAQGMINPNSKTNALRRFRDRMITARPWQFIVTQLGEVDCGFVIFYYAEKHGVTIEEQLDRSLKNYRAFLESLLARRFRKIIVLSPPPPTIIDGVTRGDIPNARKEVKATQGERTRLTLQYCDLLSEICRNLGILFIDVTSGAIDPTTGLVREDFRNEDSADHHLSDEPYSELIVKELSSSFAFL